MKKGPFDFVSMGDEPPTRQEDSFEEFEATELYCPKCSRAVPVKKSLLLVLPGGDKYEYRCQHCGETVGDKIDKKGQFYDLLKR
jgi:DNA-directed RNA polymerase subunit RPC12/RpoP